MGDSSTPLSSSNNDPLYKVVIPPFASPAVQSDQTHCLLLKRLKMVNEDLDATRFKEIGAKKELLTQTYFLEKVLETIEHGVLFIDKEGTILLCNPHSLTSLNKKKEELYQRSFWDLFPDRFFGFSLRATLFYGTLPQKAQLLLRPDVEIEITCEHASLPSPIEGLFIYLKTKASDIKERQERDKERYLRDLGKMTASLSHEMRNQLGGIRGFSSLLMRDLEEMPHLKEMARQIVVSSKHLEYYLTHALNYSKNLHLSPTATDMNRYLRDLIEFIKKDPACPEWIAFELHLPYAPLITEIDPVLMRSALLNLLFNAIEAMEGEGKITLSLLQQNDEILLTLTDTGKGIDPKTLEKIFAPFFTTKENGNGIGLAEVEKIIKTHGGRIEVRSQEMVGTTFSISLPLKEDVANET